MIYLYNYYFIYNYYIYLLFYFFIYYIDIIMLKNKTNKIDNIYDEKLMDEFVKLSKELNTLFNKCESEIKNTVHNIKTRNRKLTFIDALCYYFNYSFIGTTKRDVVSNYNFDNNINVHMSNYQKKEAIIPLSFYENIFIKIKILFNKYINKNDSEFKIIGVDGTYSNIKGDKQLETSLNMGYYNITDRIPIDIEFKGIENKNKEIKSFINHVENNKYDVKNLIFVFDRAYFSYDFINNLDEKNINYVIRSKNNSIYLKDNNKKENDNEDDIEKKDIRKKIKNKNIRFITYKDKITLIKKDKNNKDVKLEQDVICNLVTNLNIEKYNDEAIKKIYLSRWNIEVFFKLLKSNFKFANLREHNKNTLVQHKKKYMIIMIEIYITRLIEIVYEKTAKKINDNKFKKNNKHKYVVKYNNSLMIEGLKKIIDKIIKSKIDNTILFNYCNNYVIKINIQTGVNKERISKTPFTKWYVKSYSDYYKYVKIIDALVNNKFEDLNKNLKLFANELKIIK